MWAKVLPQKEVRTVITREGVLFEGGACCSGGGGTSEAKQVAAKKRVPKSGLGDQKRVLCFHKCKL